jgi:hypothetical protein
MKRFNSLPAAWAVAALWLFTSLSLFAGSEMSISGGGIIREGDKPEARKITFSLDVLVDESELASGHVQVHFHDLNDAYALDQARFSSSHFEEITIETHELDGTPYTFIRILARGRLDGEYGWSALLRFSDFGAPVRKRNQATNHSDAVRIVLMDPAYQQGDPYYYDTAFDFTRDQSWRALLDGGNISVHLSADFTD